MSLKLISVMVKYEQLLYLLWSVLSQGRMGDRIYTIIATHCLDLHP